MTIVEPGGQWAAGSVQLYSSLTKSKRNKQQTSNNTTYKYKYNT